MLSEAITVRVLAMGDAEAEADTILDIHHVFGVANVVVHGLLRLKELPFKVEDEAIFFLPQSEPALDLKRDRLCILVFRGEADYALLRGVVASPEAGLRDKEEARARNDSCKSIRLLHPLFFFPDRHACLLDQRIVVNGSVAHLITIVCHFPDFNRRNDLVINLGPHVDKDGDE